MNSDIWVEKYRPSHVKNVVMPKAYHKYFEEMVAKGECYNILLHSSVPGSGKTSLAKAIANDLNADCKYINVSAERGIDVLREKISTFAITKSIVSAGQKIIILDEFDGSTPVLQAALRAAIEEFEQNCRFILTCNYIEKIIPALREGRLNVFDFNFTKAELKEEMKPEMIKRLTGILDHEKVEYDIEAVKILMEKNYPSLRKMISTLAKIAKTVGKVTLESISTPESQRIGLYNLIRDTNITKLREMLNNDSYDFGELYGQMYNEFVPTLELQQQAVVIPILADYQYNHNFVIDQELNFMACIVKIWESLG